ncbi:MAG: CbrC family protein [Lachnospiraceae bacterium]|nr:CbrC family protein [Lachnospiraceae bacterium]
MKRPFFKYNPNVYSTEYVVKAKGKCQCCGGEVDEYVETMYCKENVECICLNCVASGEAAKKFDGSFVQGAMPLDDDEKKKELFCRTPGYLSWQGEYWLTCCNDYCAFIGEVGIEELNELGIADEVINEYETNNNCVLEREQLVKGGDICGYLFKCLHCEKYHLWVDMN